MKKPMNESFDAPAVASGRQLADLVDEHYGGWPVSAVRLVALPHKLTEWIVEEGKEPRLCTSAEFEQRRANLRATFLFVDANMASLDGTRTFTGDIGTRKWWPKLNRDEYYLMRLSTMFVDQLIKQGAEQERERIRKFLTP